MRFKTKRNYNHEYYQLSLRFKIKHSYNKWYKKLLSWIVGIALQNQAQLQRISHYVAKLQSWNCATKLSTVTTFEHELNEQGLLELRFKIKHGYNHCTFVLSITIVGITLQN
ncbi:hypothetical protein [Empedobacter stercoris]